MGSTYGNESFIQVARWNESIDNCKEFISIISMLTVALQIYELPMAISKP